MKLSKKYSVLGVMSGTSLDGIDFCWVKFHNKKGWQFEIKHAETIAYSLKWKNKLQSAHLLSSAKLHELNREYSLFLSKKIAEFISYNTITELDFISSHGHTVLHQPHLGITLQIGNLMEITQFINVPIICDFRSQDVQLGGQGAPLVPMGDQLLFNEYTYCLNLGGFANISFQEKDQRIAFDICPVNIVLNYYAEKLGFDFDKDGEIAKKNEPHEPLLYALNQLEFYQKNYPKSLGKEWVESDFTPIIEKFDLPTETIISTLTHHAAFQINKVIQPNSTLLVTGGGAFNTYLISHLQKDASVQLVLPSNYLINFKEALIFALLGVLRFRGETNVLSSVTGASTNHSSGIIYPPNE